MHTLAVKGSWAQQPASGPPPALPGLPLPAPPASAPPASEQSSLAQFPAAVDEAVRPVSGLTLGGGVVLLVPHPLSDRDRADIAVAAAPLLDLLAARGLIDGRTR